MAHRLQASALGMTIVIALVLAVVVGFFVVRQHLYQLKVIRLENKQKLITNSRSGIEVLLACDSLINYNELVDLKLFHEGADSVTLYKAPWGLYEFISAVAFSKEGHFETSALVGGWIDPSERLAIYCSDHGRPIVLGGKSAIRGDAFLPKMGIKTGVFEGQSFQGEQVVYGKQLESNDVLPSLNQTLVDSILLYSNQIFGANDSIAEIENLHADSIVNSFRLPTLVLYSDSAISISDCTLKGRIIISSRMSIWIDSQSTLDGVVILAPKIEVAAGFEGNAQLIATEMIKIGEGARLRYPSVVALIVPPTDHIAIPAQLLVEQNALVEGLMALIDKDHTSTDADVIRAEPGFELLGEIYCNGRLQIEGKVKGSIWVDRLYRHTGSGTFENHLLNTEVCAACCPEEFLSTMLLVSKKRKILKWIS
jgi:cytoskeletal protein CcmA (bactofilin family)